MTTLDVLGHVHGTDKASGDHDYCVIYENYFAHLRDEPITLLELGVGGHDDPAAGGASLRMWADWFVHGTIIGVDNQHKELDFGGRDVRLFQGDQADVGLANRLGADFGPFDIVIDDASHISSLTIAAFKNLWPHLKPGGFYVVEDTANSYHAWPGPYESSPDPDTKAHGHETMMQFFRRMADDVNFRDWIYPRRYWRGYDLQFAHFWHELVILRKSPP